MSQTITSKRKMRLRGLANGIKTRHLLGKSDIDESFIRSLDDALAANELIKIALLRTCDLTIDEAADTLSKALDAVIVQKVGRVTVLYRRNPDRPRIELD